MSQLLALNLNGKEAAFLNQFDSPSDAVHELLGIAEQELLLFKPACPLCGGNAVMLPIQINLTFPWLCTNLECGRAMMFRHTISRQDQVTIWNDPKAPCVLNKYKEGKIPDFGKVIG